jgi:hypothetical protein
VGTHCLPVHQLRSSDQRLLTVSRTRTVLASRTFKHSAVEIWNNLPNDIRKCDSLYSFRSQLKTLFFRDAFATLSTVTAPTNSLLHMARY